MNWFKAVFQILKKLGAIIDALVDLYENCETGLNDQETAEKVKALKALKK